MHRRIAVGVLAALLAAPAAAHAGPPFTFGDGNTPHVLAEASGTADLLWTNATDKTMTFCKVPRGATACTATRNLPLPPVSGAPDRAFLVRVNSGTLFAFMPIYAHGTTYAWGSTDNGATWGGPTQVYGPISEMGTEASEPILGPVADTVSFASSGRVVWSNDASHDEVTSTHATLAGTAGTDFAIAQVPGTTKTLATATDGTNAQFWRTNGGNPRDQASWTGAGSISAQTIGDLDTVRLAGGPSGAFLFGSAGGSDTPRQEIRKWDDGAGTFGAPTVLASETGYINDVTVGPNGVAAIWRVNEPENGNRLKLALSSDGGASFAVRTIARDDSVMDFMNVALAPDNQGWAVYEGAGGGATRQLRMLDLSEVPEPIAAPAPPAASPAPAPPAPKPIAPVVVPKKKLVLTKTVRVKGATLTLGVPNACIPAGKPFVATLTFKKQRRKGNLFVKVRRTDFFIGSKRLKIDKHAPFRQTLRIPNPKKGRTYVLRARASIKVKHGRAPKKSITATLKVCG